MSADPFVRRVVTVAPGDARPYDPDEWFDAIVVVETGEVDLEGRGGSLARFRVGDILWLTGLPLRALHNRGPEPVRLVAVSRRDRPLRRDGCSIGLREHAWHRDAPCGWAS